MLNFEAAVPFYLQNKNKELFDTSGTSTAPSGPLLHSGFDVFFNKILLLHNHAVSIHFFFSHLWLLRDMTLYLYFAVFAKVNSSGLAGRLRATHVLPVPRGRAEDQTVTDCLLDRGTK